METRIWHTKRPLYIGALAVGIVIFGGLLIAQAARNADVEPEEPVVVDPDQVEGGVEADPYEDEAPVSNDSLSDTFEVGIGETYRADGVSVTVRSVDEDSRCPSDVNCVWEGRVLVSVDVSGDVIQMEEGEKREVSGISLALLDVSPETISTRAINPGDYRFEFSISR